MEKRNYRFDPGPFNTHLLLLEAVQENSRVLEIGTASGYLGEYLVAEKKCEVWGVEPVKELYEDALGCGYNKLFNVTGEDFFELPEAKGEKFDVILLGDVLEHMVDPQNVLKNLSDYLKPKGRLVISLPNIANYAIRWHILTGKFDMQNGGILDRTHLRFFTLKTMKELVERSGYNIISARPSGGKFERFGLRKLFGVGRKILFTWPTLFADQFIIIAENK